MKEGGTSCFYYNLLSVKCTESENQAVPYNKFYVLT